MRSTKAKGKQLHILNLVVERTLKTWFQFGKPVCINQLCFVSPVVNSCLFSLSQTDIVFQLATKMVCIYLFTFLRMYLCSKEHSLFQALHKSYNSPNDSFTDAHKYEFFLLKHFTLPYLLANNIISDILDLDPGTKSNTSKMYSRIQSNNPPSLSKHWTPGGSVATLPRNGPKTYSIINQTNLHLLITGSIDLVTMITKPLLVLLVYVIVVYSNLLLS